MVNATTAKQTGRATKKVELCIERWPRRYVLSAIYSKEDRIAINKRNNSVREDTPVHVKEMYPHWVFNQW